MPELSGITLHRQRQRLLPLIIENETPEFSGTHSVAVYGASIWVNHCIAKPKRGVIDVVVFEYEEALKALYRAALEADIAGNYIGSPDPFCRTKLVKLPNQPCWATSYHEIVTDWMSRVFGGILELAGHPLWDDLWNFKPHSEIEPAITNVLREVDYSEIILLLSEGHDQVEILNLTDELRLEWAQYVRRSQRSSLPQSNPLAHPSNANLEDEANNPVFVEEECNQEVDQAVGELFNAGKIIKEIKTETGITLKAILKSGPGKQKLKTAISKGETAKDFGKLHGISGSTVSRVAVELKLKFPNPIDNLVQQQKRNPK